MSMKKLYYILSLLLIASISFTAFASNDSDNKSVETEVNEEANSVKVYPNPFISSLNLELDWINIETTTVRIFNIIGKQIYSETIEAGVIKINIDTNSFEKGIYFVEIINGNQIDTQRVIKR